MILNKLMPYVLADIEAGNSVILSSASGRGKSMFVKKLIQYLRKRDGEGVWGYQTCFLATMTPPDMIGYQFKGIGEFDGRKFTKTDASIPLWAVSDEGKPYWAYKRYFVFFDEFGQGDSECKRPCAEVMLNGELGPWKLPPFSARIAATNHGARYGVTKDFDFNINRRKLYPIADDLNSFLEWADEPYEHQGKMWDVSPLFKSFARLHPEVLFEKEPTEQGPWSTPRSLISQDRFVQTLDNEGLFDPKDPAIVESIAGAIGVPAATALAGHFLFQLELPQLDAVVKEPMECPVPQKPDMQMLMAYTMAAQVDGDTIGPVVKYMQRFPKDLAITFVQSLVRRDKTMVLAAPIQQWTSRNASLLAVLSSLS
jgi:DNA helicase HerA-like ATPase